MGRFFFIANIMVNLEVENPKKMKKDNEGIQKKSLKFDETVKVREIVDAPPKKMKKEKLTKKIKDKKLFKKKEKGEEKKPFEKLDKEQTREKQKKEKAERKAKKLQPEVFDIGVQAKK